MQAVVSPPTIPGTVLIVEDEALIAMDLKRRLEQAGYSVPGIANSAADAVLLATSHRPDLVLMDIRIKGERDGVDAAEQIRQELDIPVIFLTAHADSETLDRAKRAQPQGYIVKPFGSTDFRARIEIACHTHEMERRVRRSEAWLSSTLASIVEGVIAVGLDNKVEFLNPAAERITGWTAAEAKGQALQDVFCIVDTQTLLPVLNPLPGNLHESVETTRAEFHLFKRGGHTPALIESSCSLNRSAGDLRGAVIAFRDITSLRGLERQSRQIQRMDTVAVMAGALAHDFNNLLTIVLGYADILQADPLRRCNEVEQIRSAGILAARLSRDLLTVSRSTVAEPEVVDINAVMRASEKMLAQIIMPTSELRVIAAPDNLFISAESTEIQQILLNLATNARDAMPSGGLLTFDTTGSDDDSVELTARDNGIGMSAETVDRIFEPFFTRKGGKGTGLGMAIVHSIVSQWGGTIAVRSEPGCGSVFTMRWPRTKSSPLAVPAGTHTVAPVIWNARGTILLVEDNDGIRHLMNRQLRGAGYCVIDAGSGEEALTRLDLHGSHIDLVITDVMMPRMTGPELAERCVALCPGAQILFVSGYSQDILAGNELIRSGKAEFLGKPVSADDLLSKIQARMGRE